MKRIKTLETRSLCESAKNGGCGECQTSCQSACKNHGVGAHPPLRSEITRKPPALPGGAFL